MEVGWCSLKGSVRGGRGRGLLEGSHTLNTGVAVKIFLNN